MEANNQSHANRGKPSGGRPSRPAPAAATPNPNPFPPAAAMPNPNPFLPYYNPHLSLPPNVNPYAAMGFYSGGGGSLFRNGGGMGMGAARAPFMGGGMMGSPMMDRVLFAAMNRTNQQMNPMMNMHQSNPYGHLPPMYMNPRPQAVSPWPAVAAGGVVAQAAAATNPNAAAAVQAATAEGGGGVQATARVQAAAIMQAAAAMVAEGRTITAATEKKRKRDEAEAARAITAATEKKRKRDEAEAAQENAGSAADESANEDLPQNQGEISTEQGPKWQEKMHIMVTGSGQSYQGKPYLKRAKKPRANLPKSQQDAKAASNVLEQYLEPDPKKDDQELNPNLVPRPEFSRFSRNTAVPIPISYGQEAVYMERVDSKDFLSNAFRLFLGEIGWIATHLMHASKTHYPIIDQANIVQSLNTILHPKHWRSRAAEDLHTIVPGLPIPYERTTNEEFVMLVGKNMEEDFKLNAQAVAAKKQEEEIRKRIDSGDEEDPDRLIRAAADAGVYILRISPGVWYGSFTGLMATDMSGYDTEEDDEKESLSAYLRVMCDYGSRALFEKLTSSDKAKIDAALGPGHSDLPALLDTPLACTGAEDFDKVYPLPPPEYRLDACNTLPYVSKALSEFHTAIWFQYSLTPQAAAILTAAVSAILYKTYQHQLESKSDVEEGETPLAEEKSVTAEEAEAEEETDSEKYVMAEEAEAEEETDSEKYVTAEEASEEETDSKQCSGSESGVQ